eukprot:jgi/Bigna1/66814/fgenesh1_pg.2_\
MRPHKLLFLGLLLGVISHVKIGQPDSAQIGVNQGGGNSVPQGPGYTKCITDGAESYCYSDEESVRLLRITDSGSQAFGEPVRCSACEILGKTIYCVRHDGTKFLKIEKMGNIIGGEENNIAGWNTKSCVKRAEKIYCAPYSSSSITKKRKILRISQLNIKDKDEEFKFIDNAAHSDHLYTSCSIFDDNIFCIGTTYILRISPEDELELIKHQATYKENACIKTCGVMC